MDKRCSSVKGRLGEMLTADYLKKNGYKVVKMNFHSRYGEVDIIACNSQYIVFVEVKTRSENTVAAPADFVSPSKQRKLIKTASIFLQSNVYDLQPRFDVCEVILHSTTNELIDLNYIENAFCQEDGYAPF